MKRTLNTNSRKVKSAVRSYIFENISEECEAENKKDTLKNVYARFGKEYGFRVNQIGEYKAFMEWLKNGASALSVEFYTEDITKTLRAWFDQTQAEADRYTNTQQQERFLQLICREFFGMMRLKGNIVL